MNTARTDRMSGKHIQAHAALLAANLFWGIMSPISKSVLLDGQISPLALAALRIGGGALLFILCGLLLPRAVAPREKIRRADIFPIILASLLMISANQGLFILGISYTNPIDSSVMSSLTPMLTMLLAAVVLHFPITWLKALGVAIGLAGVVILVTSGGSESEAVASNPLLGDSLCFAAQLCAALYYVLFRDIINRYHPFTLMKWMFVAGAITFVPLCVTELIAVPYAELPLSTWASLLYIIIFATCLAYLTLPYAQRSLKPTVVSVYNYFQPVIAAVVAVWLGVGEFGLLKGVATLLIFAGVWFVNNNSRSTIKPRTAA